jgi:hypothetical protein
MHRPRHLEPTLAQRFLGGERRNAQDAIEVVAPPRLERGQEHRGPIGEGRRGQPASSRGAGDRRPPASGPALRHVGQDRMQDRRVDAGAVEQVFQALRLDQPAHHP